MKATFRDLGKYEVTVEAANRSNFDKSVRDLRFITEHERREEVQNLAASMLQDLISLLDFYPDTRKSDAKGKESP